VAPSCRIDTFNWDGKKNRECNPKESLDALSAVGDRGYRQQSYKKYLEGVQIADESEE